jgi:hypothetical protein
MSAMTVLLSAVSSVASSAVMLVSLGSAERAPCDPILNLPSL